jgi:serine/threonine protein kinase
VLVSSDLSCKVSDFGLSRVSSEGAAVATSTTDQVAIRWVAPEAFADRKYTSKSDVWSYGVLLFEIFSCGAKPYDGWNNQRVIDDVRKGERMEKPRLCPAPVYDVMLSTWHADPIQRPNFAQITETMVSLAVAEDDPSAQTMEANKLVQRFNTNKSKVKKTKLAAVGEEDGSDYLYSSEYMYSSQYSAHQKSAKASKKASHKSAAVSHKASYKSAASSRNATYAPASSMKVKFMEERQGKNFPLGRLGSNYMPLKSTIF